MLNDTSAIQLSQSEEQTKTQKGLFSFLYKENLTQEEFEKNMNSLLLINFKEKDNKSLSLLEQKSIALMIDYCIKYNDSILAFKLLIKFAQIKNGEKPNEKEIGYVNDFNEEILNYFKKLCEFVDLSEKSMKSTGKSGNISISNIINNYEEIITIISDYFSKEITNQTLNLSILSKYIQKVINEKIYTFYLVFSIILYNLCKNPLFENIREYIDLIKFNQFPLSSVALNSYIELLCRNNRLEECQSFVEEFLEYKPLYTIPHIIPLANNLINNTINNNISNSQNESKIIYEKHISSFGINIISFGIFLKYLCKNDHLDLALLYFDNLNSKKILKDEIIFNLLLNGCSKKGDFDNLYRIYGEMLNNGIKPTTITMNTIIDAFIRNDEIEKAWKIFGEMFKNQIEPDNFTLSTLFRGIKTVKHKEYLIKGINLVKQKYNNVDIIIINVLLDACIKLKDSEKFIDLFDELINGKFINNENNVIKADLITYNTFIKGCTQLKLYDRIDYVFEHLINNNDVGVTPNDVTFNSLIDAYVRQNNMNKVFKLISTMQQYHIKPDNFTYTTIIKGLNKDSFNNINNYNYKDKNKDELDLAFQLFEKVKQFSKPDEILYNCIMDACLRFNQVDKMLELYKEMLDNNISPSSVTCGIVIKGYGIKGDVDMALKVYQNMKINKIEISSVTYGCLINVCIKNNRLEKAFELYESLTKEGIEMNTILYTTLIKAYSKKRNLNKVIDILNIMIKSEKAKPNIITYNTVIDCCIKCNNYDLAYKYYYYLIGNNNINNTSTNNDKNEALIIRPDIITFNSLIKGEIHNGCFDKAKILMNKMLEYDYIKPDSDLLNTLLDGCEKCKSYNDALTIFDLFRKKNVSGNMMTYSILLKILGILGDFENSQKIFDEIKSNKNIAMNLIIITCFIKTCFSTNHLKEAIDTFNSLKQYKIKPDAISYVTMINGIINNSSLSDKSEYTTEIINLIKKSKCDGIILYDNIYKKVLKYLKKIDNSIFENLVKYLRDNKLFDYQYKGSKSNNYNYNNINEKNNKEINEEYNNENEKENISYKNKYTEYNDNRYDYNNKRKPLKQISYNNYNNISLNEINQNQNNKWSKNDYYNNSFKYYGSNDEKNIGYNNYNNFATNNNKWKNKFNKDKVYYNKKKGNNYY